jgi:hypothetical protein
MQDLKQVWKQILQEEAKQSTTQVLSYPVPQLKINHDKAIWVLGEQELSNQISFFVVKVFAQTTVFNSNGNLVLKSQIYTPRERSKTLVLYSMNNVFTGNLLVEALKRLEETELTIINAWVLPVVIVAQEPIKAVWEAKRSALKVLINFMREENIFTLTGHELVAKLVKQKSGVKTWSEPKIVAVKSVDNVSDEVLKVAYEFLPEFEQFKSQYNNSLFKNTSDTDLDDLPPEF